LRTRSRIQAIFFAILVDLIKEESGINIGGTKNRQGHFRRSAGIARPGTKRKRGRRACERTHQAVKIPEEFPTADRDASRAGV
jgi:hypothetical protein